MSKNLDLSFKRKLPVEDTGWATQHINACDLSDIVHYRDHLFIGVILNLFDAMPELVR